MGVKCLNYFMNKKVRGGSTVVNIQVEIENHKKTFNRSPMIVINYRALIQFACPGMEKQDILSGGRYPVYTEAFDDIFSKFRDYGAQLVFINDGPSTEIKNQCWREKRDVIYDRSINIFNDIDRKVPLSAIAMNKNIPHLKGIAEVFDPSKYGKFYKPCSGEPRNKVIASFAAKNKALAILSDDSDFLIYGGDWKFWSVYKINPELMTTREYSKANLRTTLKLDDKELSILATVMGNDYIKFTETLPFRRSLGALWDTDDFFKIACYINSHLKHLNNNELESKLAEIIFGNSSVEHTENIKASLAHYKISTKDKLLCDYSDQKEYLTEHLLDELPFPIGFCYIDMREKDKPSYYTLVISLFKREQGILWKHRQNEAKKFQIISKRFHNKPFETIDIMPEYPQFEDDPKYPENFDDLEILLFDHEHEKVNIKMKFKLLIWIMDSKILTAEILQSVMADNLKNCQRYFQDSLTLLFLVERKAITIEEADKVLSIIKSVNEGSVYKFMRKRYDRLNPRAFRISFLYSQMFINFNKVLLCSGFNAFKKTINFDGVLFHQNFENSAIDLESLQQFRFYQ